MATFHGFFNSDRISREAEPLAEDMAVAMSVPLVAAVADTAAVSHLTVVAMQVNDGSF